MTRMRGARLKSLASAVAAVPALTVVLAVAACGSDPAGTPSPAPTEFTFPAATFHIGSPGAPTGSPGAEPAPTVSRDPALSAAVKRITPILASGFADSYAGIIEDQAGHRLFVYRRPDPALDRRVRAELPAISVQFMNARYARAQMHAFSDRLFGDSDYWRARHVRIAAVVESDTGSGVDVMLVAGADPDAERLMNEHYHDMPIRVRVLAG